MVCLFSYFLMLSFMCVNNANVLSMNNWNFFMLYMNISLKIFYLNIDCQKQSNLSTETTYKGYVWYDSAFEHIHTQYFTTFA